MKIGDFRPYCPEHSFVATQEQCERCGRPSSFEEGAAVAFGLMGMAVAIVALEDKTWGSLRALNHVAAASSHAQRDGLDLTRREEIIRSMGCEILAQ